MNHMVIYSGDDADLDIATTAIRSADQTSLYKLFAKVKEEQT